ncbi:MAG TPA: DUF1564 family protein [Leptospiraceae bacterium]|nr:DUF1564 family protein [Leptospiraceae bacterium]HRG74791.1 DUF1564 family protein [Leptospiraceae bacterium]
MIVFQNSKEFGREKINEEDETVSTLLIPDHLMADFLSRTKKYKGNVSPYLRSLLRRFRSVTHTGILPDPKKIKTEYQVGNLNLRKVNFRPRNSEWVELGELALAFGKSRCWMFVHLLQLDLLGMWRILVESKLHKVVPTLPSLRLKSFWKLQRVVGNFARGYNVRV